MSTREQNLRTALQAEWAAQVVATLKKMEIRECLVYLCETEAHREVDFIWPLEHALSPMPAHSYRFEPDRRKLALLGGGTALFIVRRPRWEDRLRGLRVVGGNADYRNMQRKYDV